MSPAAMVVTEVSARVRVPDTNSWLIAYSGKRLITGRGVSWFAPATKISYETATFSVRNPADRTPQAGASLLFV